MKNIIKFFVFLFFFFFLKSVVLCDSVVFPSINSFSILEYPEAVFEHDQHNINAEIDDCSDCHHVYDKSGLKSPDESSEEQACNDCHDIKTRSKTNLRKAFHGICCKCHKREKQGPILCRNCHIKK